MHEPEQGQELSREMMEQEMRRLLVEFPHPRHQPMEAVIALHQVRELRDRIAACHRNQGGHVQNQDAQ